MIVRYRVELSQAERAELGALPPERASNGCSPLSAHASNFFEPIQTHPKSHNHCALVLATWKGDVPRMHTPLTISQCLARFFMAKVFAFP